MNGVEKLGDFLSTILTSKIPRLPKYPAITGDGLGNLFTDSTKTKIYVRLEGNGVLAEATCRVLLPRNDWKVWVGYTHEEPSLFQVLGERSSTPGTLIQAALNSIGLHANTHRWLAPGGGQDPVLIEIRAILPLRVGPTSDGSGIEVYWGWVETSTGMALVSRQTITGYTIPSTTGKAKWALITIDDSAAVVVTEGSEVDIADLPATAFPAKPAGTVKVLAAVRLYKGQTEFQEGRTNTDIVDLRGSSIVAETDPLFSASEAANFVTGDKAKLDGIEAGAEVNNISDVDATDLTDGGATTLHSHASSAGVFQRNLTADLTLQDGESLVVAAYINAGTYDITLLGDADALIIE